MRSNKITLYVIIFFIFLLSAPKAFAVPLDCKNQPEISLVRQDSAVTIKFTLDTKYDVTKVKNFYLYWDVTQAKEQPEDRQYHGTLTDRTITFDVGKPLSGTHIINLFFDGSGIGCFLNHAISIPDFAQGGNIQVKSGTITLDVIAAKSDDYVRLLVSNLPEDGLYSARVSKLVSSPLDIEYNKKYAQLICDNSKNNHMLFTFDPLAAGPWEVDINEYKLNENNECIQDYFKRNVGRGSLTVSLALTITPTPTPTPTSPFPPCAKWVTLRDYNDRKEDAPAIYPKDLPGYKISELKCVAINTAIGEISTEPQGFVKRIFSLVLGIAGGIALILIIISGYKMMASQGNPEALTNARQQLIGAIVGLLFIIFSFVILQIIGVDILHIPGFTK